jgi:TRAP transporter 4TM/12TM fusion protein
MMEIAEPTQDTLDRCRELDSIWKVVLIIFSATSILLAVLQIFMLSPFGFTLMESSYLYCLVAFYLPLVFILFPARKGMPKNKIPWYDKLLFFFVFGASTYFVFNSLNIMRLGWEFIAPPFPTLLGVVFWFMVLEAIRRTGGLVLTILCGFFSFFPLFANNMPGFLNGVSFSFVATARYHAMSTTSTMGIPMQVVGGLLVGFMLFGVALQATGGGQFFLDFAMAFMGNRRGGPAKVSVFSSGLFGTMSGSVISNVLVDGPFTIPAMIKTGYPPHYAAAIEATTSTGGALMPPIMGTSAFVMASFLNIPYATVALCAAVPALLYYAGLLFQIDCYAGRHGLKGMPKDELPPLWGTIKEGWLYIFALIALVIFVFFVRNEGAAPFYCIMILFICATIKKKTRLSTRGFLEFIADCGKLMAEITSILLAIGLVIGSLSLTGVAVAFSREFVVLVEGNKYLLLLLCAGTSFILGMGMTATACYIFLAIVIAPALVSLGLNPLAVHLFVLYWGLVSYITPPVAIAAITAAPLAGASAMKTGYAAMRLGSVIYFVPFFFVLNPALILIGSLPDIIFSVITAFIGVYFFAAGMEGYIVKVGIIGPLARVLFFLGGFMLMAPWRLAEVIGTVVLAITVAYCYRKKTIVNKLAIGKASDGLQTNGF